jgi:acetylornithine/N-succinyldiaminopimelate aminotransferase
MNLEDHPLDALMEITARPAVVFVRGEGAWLWDHTGRKYLDFVQGWAVNCLGHSPDAIADALAVQSADGWTLEGRGIGSVGIVTWAPR